MILKEYQDIHQLAIRYFNGTITREEEHTLQQFLAGGEENCALFREWEDEWTVSHLWRLIDDGMLFSMIVYNDVSDAWVEAIDIEVCMMEGHTISEWLYFLYFEIKLAHQRILSRFLDKIGIVVGSALGKHFSTDM